MEAEEIKINDKVVPLIRTTRQGTFAPAHSVTWQMAQKLNPPQPYLYAIEVVIDTPSGVPVVLCALTPSSSRRTLQATLIDPEVIYADWFQDTDLVPYTG